MPPKSFPTHFLCIPLVNATSRVQLAQSLAAFTADVITAGIPSDAVRPVGTMHLTLGVCSFPKNEGLDRAVDLLKSLRPREILATARQQVAARTLPGEEPSQGVAGKAEPPQPLLITLRGLASMQTASNASVLYARPTDDQGVLQAFCEELRRVFLEAELMQEDSRPLLLHATVLNTIYVKNAPAQGGGNKRKRGRRGEKLAFDARPIIDRYEDQIWMEGFPVERIALCRMGAKEVDVDGVSDEVYEAVAEIDF